MVTACAIGDAGEVRRLVEEDAQWAINLFLNRHSAQSKDHVADFFIICSGNSDTQLDAIADSIEKEAKERAGETPWHREGKENREWILLDYVTVVAHVFKRERREFFALEELWGDAIITEVDSDVSLKTL
ncbi:MAG: ribosome silencing factor [Bacteroidota bacterium]